MSSEQTGDQATEQAGDQPTDQTASRPGGEPADQQGEQQVVIVGPDGKAVGTVPASMLAAAAGGEDAGDEAVRNLNDLVEQPAKVMRIGSMIRQLLEEVKAAPLDEASRARLKEIHAASIKELEQGLAPELVDELERLSLPFADGATPSEGELRIAQAQLVGWLEGLFHGIQTAIYAQQLAARAQFEQMRRALPGGAVPGMPGQHGQPPMGAPGQPQQAPADDDRSSSGGMYL